MKIPKSWKDIKLHQFYQLRLLLETRDLPGIDRNVQLVAAHTGSSVEQVEELTFSQIAAILKQVSFMDKMPDPKPKGVFRIGRRMYSVITNPAKLTPGQFIDICTFTKDPERILENTHNILAVISVPLFRKYKGSNHKEIAERFLKELDVEFAYSLALFFCSLLQAFVDATKDYLESKIDQQMTEIMTRLEKEKQTSNDSSINGAGTMPSTASVNYQD